MNTLPPVPYEIELAELRAELRAAIIREAELLIELARLKRLARMMRSAIEARY